MSTFRPEQMDVVTGAADNDFVTTKGYVDDAIGVENLWDRTTGTINFVSPHFANDSVSITKTTNAVSDYVIKTDMTLTANVDGVAGNISEVTGYASGMTGGKEVKAYEAILTGSASDIDVHYAAYKAADFTSGGGSHEANGLYIGQNYTFGVWLESASIIMSDDANTHTINCTRSTTGHGTDFILNAASGISVGAPQNGGNFIISAGDEDGGGTDGEVQFKIGSALKGKFDSDGKFELTSGTGINEIVTSISVASTDDQAASAKAIWDLHALTDSWNEVMHLGNTFTVLDTENLSATITQNDTTNNPAALILENTGSGNDITLPNSSYIKNGTLALGANLEAVGYVQADSLKINDTNDSNTLEIFWGDNDSSDRTLAFLVNSGNRRISVEADTVLDQDYTTDASVRFGELTIDNLNINGNTVSSTSGDVDITSVADINIKSTSATGVISWLKDTGLPALSYNNNTDQFVFSDDIAVAIGGEIEVNTINNNGSIFGVTIEGVQLLNDNIKADKIQGLTSATSIDIDKLTIDTTSTGFTTISSGDVTNVLTLAGGASSAILRLDRGATNQNATIEYQTASVTKWTAGLVANEGDDYLIKSSGIADDIELIAGSTTGNVLINPGSSGAAIVDGYINQEGIFAEIYVADASTAQLIATGVTYTKSTAFTTDGQSSNCTAAAASDKITITQIGRYRVSGACSAISGTANVTWRGAAFLDGVEQDQVHWKRKMATNTDAGTMSFTGFIDVTTAPLDLDLRLRHDNGGGVNFTVEYANLNVEYIGAT